jgi:manganese-dependent inorganic pyrophosphatase
MSTTTHQDKKAVLFLAKIAGEDYEKLGVALLEAGMDLAGVPLAVLLKRDTKDFELSGKKVLIAQVIVPAFSWNRERSAAIAQELEALRAATGNDLAFALFTNVVENASDLYGAGDAGMLSALYGSELPARLAGVMSRKKDFLPVLGERLKKTGRT